jgi:hypothetical protein
MYTELHSITFGVVMTVEEFLIMDAQDYEVILSWFPKEIGIDSLEWNGHFGPQLIVTCSVDDIQAVNTLLVKVRNIVVSKVEEMK